MISRPATAVAAPANVRRIVRKPIFCGSVDNLTSGRAVRQKNKPTKKPVHYSPCRPTKPVSANKKRDRQDECRGSRSQIDMRHAPLRRAPEANGSEEKKNASQNCKWIGQIDVKQPGLHRNIDLKQHQNGCCDWYHPGQHKVVVDRFDRLDLLRRFPDSASAARRLPQARRPPASSRCRSLRQP